MARISNHVRLSVLFDNFYLGHSEEDAKKFAEETWKAKNELEKAEEEVSKPPEVSLRRRDLILFPC
jgi:hypothetical protein